MSRRHKTPEELEKIQSQQRGSQGDCSQKVTPSCNDSVDNCMTCFVVTNQDGFRSVLPIENIANAITKTFLYLKIDDPRDICQKFLYELSIPLDITLPFLQTVIEGYKKRKAEEDKKNGRRGKQAIDRLLGGYANKEVCSWFDKLCKRFKRFIGNLKQMLCCFFCAIFDIVKTESPHQKETCYYKIMKKHIGEKIPSLSTIQKGIKWFWEWRKGVLSWADSAWEEREHSIWEQLYRLIMGELPKLQPRLAMC